MTKPMRAHDQDEQMDLEEAFGPVISSYSDAQAVDDGVLVAISKRDRVTRNLWGWTVDRVPDGAKPPNRWPVPMLDWFGAKDNATKARALWVGLIEQDRKRATEVYEQNIGGGIHTVEVFTNPPDTTGTIESIGGPNDAAALRQAHVSIWLMPNELGGITAMFPEDY